MRYIDGQEYATVGEVAEAAGVSAQTVRLWERLGRVVSQRSPGGHRLYDSHALKAVVEYAAKLRREERTRATTPKPQISGTAIEFASTGAQIRAARLQRRFTQEQVAGRAGISRSLLSAVERGDSGVSVHVFNRIADALGMPMSDLAPSSASKSVMRAADRPRTVMADGVSWEELTSSGHSMAPAVLIVPTGASSGGLIDLSRENFVTIIEGELTFDIGSPAEKYVLAEGDSIILAAGLAHSWSNSGDVAVKALWVEQLSG